MRDKSIELGKKTRALSTISLEDRLGKIPPQAIDLEEAVLGAIILESNAIHETVNVLKPEYFYKESHQKIYSTIVELYAKSEPIDLLTVTNNLRSKGELELVGGAYYISEITTKINSAAHIEAHAKIIIEKWIKRECIRIASEIHHDAYEDTIDAFELLNRKGSEFMSIQEHITKGSESSYNELLQESVDLTIDRQQNESKLIGISSGFTDIDKNTGGLIAPDLIILAARPGMGKTALALEIALNAAKANIPTAVFSLEMSKLQLTQRTQAQESEINLQKIIKGDLNEYELNRFIHVSDKLKTASLFIDDTAGLSLLELRSKCHILKHKHNIKLIVVDYLQLMSYDGDRDEAIGKISKGLKKIAKDLNVPIIALSQLSRAVEKRGGDKRPQLSDLRESGSIEADADIVWFAYRPEYYGIYSDENGNDLRGMAELIIAKHRQGSLDIINLRFLGEFVKFKDFIEEVPQNFKSLEDEPKF